MDQSACLVSRISRFLQVKDPFIDFEGAGAFMSLPMLFDRPSSNYPYFSCGSQKSFLPHFYILLTRLVLDRYMQEIFTVVHIDWMVNNV